MSTQSEGSNGQLVPPYVPYKTFKTFLEEMKQGIPSRIDRSVLGGKSGTAQSQILHALSRLGLVNEAGVPEQSFIDLVNAEGQERSKVLQDILKRTYSSLFNDDFNLASATSQQLDEKIKDMGASGGTIPRCAVFFTQAANEAGFDVSPHITTRRRTRRSPRKPQASVGSKGRSSRSLSPLEAPSENEHESQQSSVSTQQILLERLMDKFPEFDPEWDSETQARWLDMFEQLLTRSSAENRG